MSRFWFSQSQSQHIQLSERAQVVRIGSVAYLMFYVYPKQLTSWGWSDVLTLPEGFVPPRYTYSSISGEDLNASSGKYFNVLIQVTPEGLVKANSGTNQVRLLNGMVVIPLV